MPVLFTVITPVLHTSISVCWVKKLMNQGKKKGSPTNNLTLSSMKHSWFFHGSISGICSFLLISADTILLLTLIALVLDYWSHIIIFMWFLASSDSHLCSSSLTQASSSHTPISKSLSFIQNQSFSWSIPASPNLSHLLPFTNVIVILGRPLSAWTFWYVKLMIILPFT